MSNDHAQSAANIFSLIAGCKLYYLDPENYLKVIIRIMPPWPSERYLEPAPRYWASTRSRLDAGQLRREVGPITVPRLFLKRNPPRTERCSSVLTR